MGYIKEHEDYRKLHFTERYFEAPVPLIQCTTLKFMFFQVWQLCTACTSLGLCGPACMITEVQKHKCGHIDLKPLISESGLNALL